MPDSSSRVGFGPPSVYPFQQREDNGPRARAAIRPLHDEDTEVIALTNLRDGLLGDQRLLLICPPANWLHERLTEADAWLSATGPSTSETPPAPDRRASCLIFPSPTRALDVPIVETVASEVPSGARRSRCASRDHRRRVAHRHRQAYELAAR